MKRLRIALAAIILFGLASLPGYAEEAPANSPGTAGLSKGASTPAPETAIPAKEDERLPIHKDEWQFFLSPYLWITGVNVNVTTLNHTMGVSVPWWEAASTLFSKTFGVMGRAEAWKGRWGFYLDGYYAYVGASGSQVGAGREKTFGPVDFTLAKQVHLGGATINVGIPGQVAGNVTLTPSSSVKFITRIGNLDLGGRFLVGAWPLSAEKPLPAVSVEILGGPRFNSINQYFRINLSAIRVGNVPIDLGKFSFVGRRETIKNGSYVIDYNNQYFEPFVGARIGLWLTPKWIINFKGTVGGFGLVADDHVDCDLEALVGYRVHKNIYLYGGYRARGTWYNLGQGLIEINASGWAHGPVLGTTIAF